MHSGVMMDLRARPGGSAALVLLSFLLPLILGLLPPLTPTPAFALERSIATSRCDPLGTAERIPGERTHESCCVLGHCCVVPAAAAPEAAPVPLRRALPAAAVAVSLGPDVLRTASWPGIGARAPPAV